jgi:hypothetical protein
VPRGHHKSECGQSSCEKYATIQSSRFAGRASTWPLLLKEGLEAAHESQLLVVLLLRRDQTTHQGEQLLVDLATREGNMEVCKGPARELTPELMPGGRPCPSRSLATQTTTLSAKPLSRLTRSKSSNWPTIQGATKSVLAILSTTVA